MKRLFVIPLFALSTALPIDTIMRPFIGPDSPEAMRHAGDLAVHWQGLARSFVVSPAHRLVTDICYYAATYRPLRLAYGAGGNRAGSLFARLDEAFTELQRPVR